MHIHKTGSIRGAWFTLISLKKIAAIVAGSVLIAVGINFFLVPLRLLDGGVIGIALIINYLFKLKVGLVMLLCSIPILALSWYYKLRGTLYYSINGLLFSSYMIDLLEPYQYYFLYYVDWTPFTRSVIGGAVIGTGIGIMLRHDCSTGGMDLLAKFISKHLPVNVGVLILIMDAIIISFGKLLLPEDTFLLSFITIIAGGIATSLCTLNLPATAHNI
ncbi:YitT family protein [Paenibacillus sp. sptzw28]|uniref:YitT family protein n=1 Tax=Paenibacillus sp. sptzw28 TaxID=715179 RepID=UPI0021638A02|nr:YitT family protein [Paenibacillus sp. sptzw28]